MRLVIWNANWNRYAKGKKPSLEDFEQMLAPLEPDVAVISETGRAIHAPERFAWIGRSTDSETWPGLGVYARNGYSITRLEPMTEEPRFLLPVEVHGPVSFRLLAAWSNSGGTATYHKVPMHGLQSYGEWLRTGNAIVAGDLNSTGKLASQEKTHRKLVAAARDRGLVSVYHHQHGHEHGREAHATFLKSGVDDHTTGLHVDYCFVSQHLLPDARVEIGPIRPWRRWSDHLPVILHIPDARFTT